VNEGRGERREVRKRRVKHEPGLSSYELTLAGARTNTTEKGGEGRRGEEIGSRWRNK
jgi:hypothetical protein